MKLDSNIIFLIAILGIITAGVVGATVLNNGAMKQVEFDGIKVNVPSDSNFVQTNEGYVDSTHGITIKIFKDNNSVVSYLGSAQNVSVISLKNQPPQSLAFTQNENTNIVITNGGESILIQARDQGLVADMANSVVFSNHQRSTKPTPVLGPHPHLEIGDDFNLMMLIIAQVNTEQINVAMYESTINVTINDYNAASDQGTLPEYTDDQYFQTGLDVLTSNSNTSPDGSNTTTNSTGSTDSVQSNNGGGSSIMDTPEGSNFVQHVNDESGSAGSDDGGSFSSDGGSSSGGSSVGDDSGSTSSSGSSTGDSGDSGEHTEQECKNYIKEHDIVPAGSKLVKKSFDGTYYVFKVKDSSGQVIGEVRINCRDFNDIQVTNL